MKTKTVINYTQTKNVIFQEVDGLIHILDQKKDAIVTLNDTATLLWLTLVKPHSSDALVTELLKAYEIDSETATNDVNEFLDTMLKAGFIAKMSN